MIQRDLLTLKTKADARPQLLAQLKGDDKKDGCAGTFHAVGDCHFPCTGEGYIIKRYEQTTYTTTQREHAEIIGALKESINIKKGGELFDESTAHDTVEITVCRPLAVDVCPCKKSEQIDEYQQGILRDLGVEKVPKLTANQAAGLTAFKKRKGLFIFGETGQGKSTLAAACAMTYQRGVTVQKGDDIHTELKNMALNNLKPKYKGLLIHDDISRMKPTEATREKLFLIFDAARAGQFQYIITSQDSPEEVCEKFSLGDKNAHDAMLNRISALTEVKLP